MQRNIFIVNAYVVDVNGTFNSLSGYPKTFDSRNYNNDIDSFRLSFLRMLMGIRSIQNPSV